MSVRGKHKGEWVLVKEGRINLPSPRSDKPLSLKEQREQMVRGAEDAFTKFITKNLSKDLDVKPTNILKEGIPLKKN